MLRPSSKLANFSQNVIKNLPLNPNQVKRYVADKCCPSGASQTTKTAEDSTDSATPFKNDAFVPLEFLPITSYRPLSDAKEVLGPGAHKCKEYKNPEYYAYHRFSFYELQNATLNLAKCAKGGVLYEAESDSENEDACMESENGVDALKGEKDDAKEGKEWKENNEKEKNIAEATTDNCENFEK